MHIDLRDLRLIQRIARTGTITGGAELENMTLASASQRVKGMESEVGVPLFIRSKSGVEATAAGLALIRHAGLILRQFERMKAELGEQSSCMGATVRLLCNASAMAEDIPSGLTVFLQKHQSLSVDIVEAASDEIVEALCSGRGDVGIVSSATPTHGLQCFDLRDDDLVLIVPIEHRMATRRSIRLLEVASAKFVGLAASNALQKLIARHARSLDYRARTGSLDALCRLVGEGIGLAVVPRTTARRCGRAAGVRGIPLEDAWATRHLVACIAARSELSPAADMLLEHLLGLRQLEVAVDQVDGRS